jgi:hypothetical protein
MAGFITTTATTLWMPSGSGTPIESVFMTETVPPNALQRTAAGYRGCNRRVSWPPSLRYIWVVGRQQWHSHTCLGAQSKERLRSVRH